MNLHFSGGKSLDFICINVMWSQRCPGNRKYAPFPGATLRQEAGVQPQVCRSLPVSTCSHVARTCQWDVNDVRCVTDEAKDRPSCFHPLVSSAMTVDEEQVPDSPC